MMTARTARRVAIPVAIAVALGLAFGAWMIWLTSSAKSSWVVPGAYSVSADGRVVTLYGWGGACDEPLTAHLVTRGATSVSVAMLRAVPPGSCTANAVVHEVDVALGEPLGGREVHDRTGVTIPVVASAAEVIAHPREFGFGSG